MSRTRGHQFSLAVSYSLNSFTFSMKSRKKHRFYGNFNSQGKILIFVRHETIEGEKTWNMRACKAKIPIPLFLIMMNEQRWSHLCQITNIMYRMKIHTFNCLLNSAIKWNENTNSIFQPLNIGYSTSINRRLNFLSRRSTL